ncbi:3-oxoadipate enol-lactonase [Stappia taiwanensis]|uniref:3-oxoadipate enol-lactonase n=2 Tax=Stappia taiwanensis TaxID=992267 RepID=A0A838XTN1_9HYPH|nr:3-oxoadipate enol-lactonase [Stappia taiwanensis]MBA4611896.1 3-oxoadipate enol-lactonase [Stappia taiwanensis]
MLRPGSGDEPCPTVVFSNSLGTDLRIWDRVIAALPSDWHLLRYDTAGHGLSSGGTSLSIEDHGADLVALVDAFDIDRAVIVGLSVGGLIAQSVALARPERVAGLVLSNTAARIGTPDLWSQRIAAIAEGGMAAIADGIMERWFSARFRRECPDDLALCRTMLAHTPVDGYTALAAAIRDADFRPHASRITAPTLCIGASDDAATPPDAMRALAGLIPGAVYQELSGPGHLPCIEAPEAMAGLIRAFIDSKVSA